MKVIVRFEYGQENRFSDPYGPFDAIQVTYDLIRALHDDTESEIAFFHEGLWKTPYDGKSWSDFIVEPSAQ